MVLGLRLGLGMFGRRYQHLRCVPGYYSRTDLPLFRQSEDNSDECLDYIKIEYFQD